jgi:hypothetical protein
MIETCKIINNIDKKIMKYLKYEEPLPEVTSIKYSSQRQEITQEKNTINHSVVDLWIRGT